MGFSKSKRYMWDRDQALQIFTPRIQKVLRENEVKVDLKDVDHLCEKRGSLLINGSVGAGKTIYGSAVLLKCMSIMPGNYTFVKEPELFQNIRDSYGKDVDFSMDFLYEGIVLIDDLGAEKITEWVLDQLYQIVDYRYENRLPTIFTTNLNGEQLADRLGDRIPDRLEEMCKIVRIEGKSKRQKNPS